MANVDISSVVGIIDKRRGKGLNGTELLTEINNLTSIAAMRARLAAINGTYYTATRLDQMTENDMVYALRDAASI